jgi:hypothetical protein
VRACVTNCCCDTLFRMISLRVVVIDIAVFCMSVPTQYYRQSSPISALYGIVCVVRLSRGRGEKGFCQCSLPRSFRLMDDPVLVLRAQHSTARHTRAHTPDLTGGLCGLGRTVSGRCLCFLSQVPNIEVRNCRRMRKWFETLRLAADSTHGSTGFLIGGAARRPAWRGGQGRDDGRGWPLDD